MSDDDETTIALHKACADEAQRLISKLPSEIVPDRKLIHDMLEIAFIKGSIFGSGRAHDRIMLALSEIRGGTT